MLPHEAIREAAKLIEAGWCQSDGSHLGHARNEAGAVVPLWVGAARSDINPQAARYTVYGAIATVMRVNRVERAALIFDVLYNLAIAHNGHPPGGSNYVHPLLAFNEAPGRTREQVLAMLDMAANDIERIGSGPFPSPIPKPSAASLETERGAKA